MKRILLFLLMLSSFAAFAQNSYVPPLKLPIDMFPLATTVDTTHDEILINHFSSPDLFSLKKITPGTLLKAMGGGTGTVTNVGGGYGLLGGPITISGTLRADTVSYDGLVTKALLNSQLGPYVKGSGVGGLVARWVNTNTLSWGSFYDNNATSVSVTTAKCTYNFYQGYALDQHSQQSFDQDKRILYSIPILPGGGNYSHITWKNGFYPKQDSDIMCKHATDSIYLSKVGASAYVPYSDTGTGHKVGTTYQIGLKQNKADTNTSGNTINGKNASPKFVYVQINDSALFQLYTKDSAFGIHTPGNYSSLYNVLHQLAIFTGSSNIVTLGTITSCVYHGTAVGAQYGGTGINTSASTGVAQVSGGTWSVSTTLPSGLAATNLSLTTPSIGTPQSGVLTNCTGLPLTSGVTGILPSGNLPTDVSYIDVQQSFTKSKAVTPSLLTDASTVSVDLSQSNNFILPLTGNHNLGVPTNPLSGQTGWLDVYQDATGSRTLFGTPAWCYTAAAATFPTLTTTALARDKLTYVVDYYSTASVTCTSASPGVVTWTSHGLQSGDRIAFTGGTAPTGTSLNTLYFVTVVSANTFKLSTSYANFQAGTFVNTSSTGSAIVATAMSITIGTSCLDCR